MSCIVPWCREKKKDNSNVSFFYLPKNLLRRNKWLAYACIKDFPGRRSAYFCSKHFEEQWILTTPVGKILHFNAVPSIPPPLDKNTTVKMIRKSKRALRGGRKKNETVNFADQEFFQIEELNDGEDSEVLLESVKKQLCRVCGRKRTTLIPIFEKCKRDGVPLVEKIEMHLPLKIQKDDRLPLNVCVSCDAMVQSWYDLHVTCLAADAALRRMFEPARELFNEFNHINESDMVLGHSDLISNDESVILHNVEIGEDYLKPEGEIKDSQDLDMSVEESGLVEGLKYTSDEDFEQTEFRTHCSFCDEEFNAFQTLKIHKIQCRSRFTVCEFCGLSVQVRYLKTHISKVHEKNMLCEMCGDFFTWYKLKTHINECVLGPTSYCEPCGRLFYSDDAFRSHIDGHERGEVQSLEIEISASITDEDAMSYLCPVCEETFRDKLSVIEHLNSYKITVCNFCNMDFRNERSFIAHVCTTTPKVWQCQFCFKVFKRKEALQLHEKVHVGVYPFNCKHCGERLPSKTSLARHLFTHGPSSFTCPYCYKKFKRRATLRHHIHRHEGFSFKCRDCTELFVSYQDLWEHENHCSGKFIGADISVQVEIVEKQEKPIKLLVQRISDEESSK